MGIKVSSGAGGSGGTMCAINIAGKQAGLVWETPGSNVVLINLA